MKNLFYKLSTQTFVTFVTLLLVFAPFVSLTAQAATDSAFTSGAAPVTGTNAPVGGGTQTSVTNINSAGTVAPASSAENPSNTTNTFNSNTNFPSNTNTNISSLNAANGNIANTPPTASASTPLSAGTTNPSGDIFGNCGISNISACVLSLIYAFTIGIGSVFAYVAAYFFDITIQLSLNGASYGLDFISTSWTTARDLGNMAFLFILLYIAFTIIFKADTSSTKTMLAMVIIVALLVNFSFFFSRVVIDAGNILSIQFYNAIPAPPISQTIQGSPIASTASTAASVAGVAGGTKDLTAGVMNMLNIQGLLNNNSFASTNGNFIATVFIYIAGAIVLWMLTVAFITNGIKFLFRIVVLWFLIIASPLALIAIAIQGTGGYFKQWRDMLLQHAFYPVAFMFVFLVLNNFAVTMSSSNGLVGGVFTTLSSNSGTQTWSAIGAALVSLVIRLGLVVGVLYVAMQASNKFSIAGSSYAEKAGGWFGGKLKSGMLMPVRLAGREGLGRYAYNVNENFKKNPSTNWAGRLMDRGIRSAVAPIANAKFGGSKSFNDVVKARKDDKTEVNNAIRDQENKERIKAAAGIAAALKPLEKIEKNFKEFTELQAKVAAGIALSADETAALAAHTAAGTKDLTTAEKDRKDDLNNKMEDVKSRVKNLNKREIEAMSTDDIKEVAHLMNESQIKAIKDSDSRNDKDKEAISNKWQEEASGAPLQKANKEIEQLRKIEHDLRASGVMLTTINTTLGTKYSPHVGNTIDSGKVEAMVNNVNAQIASVNSAIRAAPPGASTVAERQNLNNLQKALKTLEKLDDARSNVPASVGGEVASGKFKTK